MEIFTLAGTCDLCLLLHQIKMAGNHRHACFHAAATRLFKDCRLSPIHLHAAPTLTYWHF